MRMTDSLAPGERIEVKVTLHPHGALSVEGAIYDKAFCIAMLENAIDAVRNHGMAGLAGPGLAVPERDVSVPALKVKVVQ